MLPAPAEREPAALTGSRLFGPVQRAGPRNSASAETTCGQSAPTKVQPYPIAYSCGRRPDGDHAIDWVTGAAELILGYSTDEIQAFGCWGRLVLEEDRPLFEKNVTGLAPLPPACASFACARGMRWPRTGGLRRGAR